MLCCTPWDFHRSVHEFNSQNHWMNDLQSTFLVLCFPTPYQLPYFVLDNFESLLFSLRLDLPFCVGIYQSYQIDSVFPPSIRPLSTMLWSRAVVSRVEYNWLTNRFHAAVLLFSKRSQMTSKCGKTDKEVAVMFLPDFDVTCDLLLKRPTETWNLFVLYNDQKRKKIDKHTFLVPLDCSKICASLGLFGPRRYISSLLLLFFFILLVYSTSFLEKFFNTFSCSKQNINDSENILQNSESLVAMTHDGNRCENFL